MPCKNRYGKAKAKLLGDTSICDANRQLFSEFFEFEEYKLKRQNGLRELDAACYKTLYGYVVRLRNVNRWFNNKPWRNLTREDIRRVYDDLEDGRIMNQRGVPFEDRASYYNKVFKSKPFRLAGKSELAKEVIEFSIRSEKAVRYVTEETFRTMVSVVANPKHLLLFWLAWDIGENVGALLQLTKNDFRRQRNEHTGEAEYLVNLPQSKIKRSRQTRSEPTLYPETVRYADMVLTDLSDDELVFGFGHRHALQIIHRVARKSSAKCMPQGEPPTWKDLRSGMACHLLKSGWSREEVDARLGHTPNSSALNAYINFLAIDRGRPKKKLFDSSLRDLQFQLEETLRREKLTRMRLQKQEEDNGALRSELTHTQSDLVELRSKVEKLMSTIMPGSRQSSSVETI